MNKRTQDEYATAAWDGYRARLTELDAEQALILDACLVQNREVVDEIVLFEYLAGSAEDYQAAAPHAQRLTKLASAILRFLNEGGELDAAVALFEKLSDWHREKQVSPILPLHATASDEQHERVFLCPDGRYLYIREDLESELLTEQQLRDEFVREDADP